MILISESTRCHLFFIVNSRTIFSLNDNDAICQPPVHTVNHIYTDKIDYGLYITMLLEIKKNSATIYKTWSSYLTWMHIRRLNSMTNWRNIIGWLVRYPELFWRNMKTRLHGKYVMGDFVLQTRLKMIMRVVQRNLFMQKLLVLE